MIKRNVLKKLHKATTLLQNFNDFRAKLEYLKTDILTLFQKSISQSVSILVMVIHPHFPMGFNH